MHWTIFATDLTFVLLSTVFFVGVDRAWHNAKPYELPYPLPGWFNIWFSTVQLIGVLLPLVAIVIYSWQQFDQTLIAVFASYFFVLGIQILTEWLTLRKVRSVIWVMVPYLYVPYRIWQLYQGTVLLDANVWIQTLLITEIIVWTLNYALDLSQLPRLLRWQVSSGSHTD